MQIHHLKLELILLLVVSSLAFSQSRYELQSRSDLLDLSAKILIDQLGTIETGDNSGENIRLFQLSVGLPDHSPYCAAGQYYCFSEAVIILNLPISEIPIPRTGLANCIFSFAKINGTRTHYKASMHDLIVWRKSNSIHGHVERVVSVSDKGWVKTVGFNTSSFIAGHNAEGVFIQKRNICHPLGRMKIRGLVGFTQRRGS